MDTHQNINKELVERYRLDGTILQSYFKNSRNEDIKDVVFPLRVDARQYCSPTDHQGDKPSCCGYTTAQMLESLNWMDTGKIVQMDANQIYAKAKEEDKQIEQGGTYPDLAMQKGLELIQDGVKKYKVLSSTSKDISELKRVIHKHMFASVNMVVTSDIYGLDCNDFMYKGDGKRAGGHSMMCCGYDDPSKMLIVQNHWGKDWGMKGFFLCPYDVWEKQCNIFCWYERI